MREKIAVPVQVAIAGGIIAGIFGLINNYWLSPVKPPMIKSFIAKPAEIVRGESSELNWQIENADRATITGIAGVEGVSLSGSFPVNPDTTTVYTLVARRRGASTEASAVLNVTNPRGPEVPPPNPDASPPADPVEKPLAIVRFDADPTSIAEGRSANLHWDVLHADGVQISPRVGDRATKGSASVSPRRTTTYVLEAKGPGGTRKASTTVNIEQSTAPPPPPEPAPSVISFEAGPMESRKIK